MSLRAPIAVTVELGAAGRRAFRLARSLGEDGLRLERPAPFEVGRPVELRFAMPDGDEILRLHAEVRPADGDVTEDEGGPPGGRDLAFLSLSPDDRMILRRYVLDRLDLPGGA